MNTNTRRAATLTAALIIAGTLAACGEGEPESGVAETTPMQACVTYYTENPASTVDVPVEEFCEAEREFDPAAFDSRFGGGEAAMQDEVGDGAAAEGESRPEGIAAGYGQPVELPDGLGTIVASEPVATTVYDNALEPVDGVAVEFTYTNTSDEPVDPMALFVLGIFSGEGGGEWASCSDGSDGGACEAPLALDVPAGRTAVWTDQWSVEDPADVTLTLSSVALNAEFEQAWTLTFSNEATEGEDW